MPLIHSLLGPQAKLVYAGLILSFPNSADQPWHQDGEALFGGVDVGELPPYALNVFVPLESVTPELGPTEFWVGSHTESTCREVMEQLQTGNDTNDNIISPLLQKGDVLIYDYRICHRGTRNLSTTEVRPMLYLMYARPWFHEHLNFGTDRLFPDKK
jgi:ectoine hydroxylase-related dioxygenase (phytanoyl-CoA dioxygenase family)